MVGLPNPTGFLECCPASVVEMSGCQAAVVALRQWGMCDTVVDRVTGFLCRHDREYVDRVISLFSDPNTAQAMGVAGRRLQPRRLADIGDHGSCDLDWHLYRRARPNRIERADIPAPGRRDDDRQRLYAPRGPIATERLHYEVEVIAANQERPRRGAGGREAARSGARRAGLSRHRARATSAAGGCVVARRPGMRHLDGRGT